MEGLEASIESSNQLERTSRIDAEFFQKRFLRSAVLIGQWKRSSIAALACVSDGNHFSISDDFVEDGIPYYRGQDVTGRFFVETASPIHITRDAYDRKHMERSYLERGDVLLSIVGTIGELSLVASHQPATCSCKLAILRPRDGTLPEFLAVFLRSEHGQNQIERLTRGAVQKGLILEDMDQLWVPSLSEEFEKRIAQVVRTSRNTQEQSETKQKEAEDTLLEALGLADWEPPEPLSYTARASDAFAAGRLDAQYFSSKFDELLERLSASAARMETVRDIRSYNARGLQPEYVPEGDVYVINSRHILEARVDYEGLERTSTEWLKINERARLQPGDILTYTTGAKIGRTAHFALSDPAVASNHVNILRLSKGNQEYVAFVMNSLVGRLQTERHLSGTAQPELYPRNIDKFIVPFIPDGIQSSITASLRESEELRAQARQLLETAKRAVEIALEDGETAAMTFLDQAEGAN